MSPGLQRGGALAHAPALGNGSTASARGRAPGTARGSRLAPTPARDAPASGKKRGRRRAFPRYAPGPSAVGDLASCVHRRHRLIEFLRIPHHGSRQPVTLTSENVLIFLASVIHSVQHDSVGWPSGQEGHSARPDQPV